MSAIHLEWNPARAIERNTKLQSELEVAKAEIRQLKAERFGKKTEKQSASDRTNQLDDPNEQTAPKKKRGRQPGSPSPKRRDYAHLPARNSGSRCSGRPCRKVLESLTEHWDGLTLFVNDSRIPMDNNYGERLIRGPAVGRKNYYGSGAEWSGRLAMMLFSIFATLTLRKINPRRWLK